MSKYSNWGNFKSKNFKFNNNKLETESQSVDLNPFNGFSQSETVETVSLNDNMSIMLISSEEETGYAVLNNQNGETVVLEANIVSDKSEIDEMLIHRDIALGTIASSEATSSPEHFLAEEKSFAYEAEMQPNYISNESLPQGCEVMVVYDQATNSYSASIIKNGEIVDTINSESISSSREFAETIAQSAMDSSAIDPRQDENNIKAAQALAADSYMIDMIQKDIDNIRALHESEENKVWRDKWDETLDKADGVEAYEQLGKGCDLSCKHDIKEVPIEIGDDSKYNKPAEVSETHDTYLQEKGLDDENEMDGPERSLSVHDN